MTTNMAGVSAPEEISQIIFAQHGLGGNLPDILDYAEQHLPGMAGFERLNEFANEELSNPAPEAADMAPVGNNSTTTSQTGDATPQTGLGTSLGGEIPLGVDPAGIIGRLLGGGDGWRELVTDSLNGGGNWRDWPVDSRDDTSPDSADGINTGSDLAANANNNTAQTGPDLSLGGEVPVGFDSLGGRFPDPVEERSLPTENGMYNPVTNESRSGALSNDAPEHNRQPLSGAKTDYDYLGYEGGSLGNGVGNNIHIESRRQRERDEEYTRHRAAPNATQATLGIQQQINALETDLQELREEIADHNFSAEERREIEQLLEKMNKALENGNLEKAREYREKVQERIEEEREETNNDYNNVKETTSEVQELLGDLAEAFQIQLQQDNPQQGPETDDANTKMQDLQSDLIDKSQNLQDQLSELETSIQAYKYSIYDLEQQLDSDVLDYLNPFDSSDITLQAQINTQKQQLEELEKQYEQTQNYSEQLDAVLSSEGQLDIAATRKAIEDGHVSADEWAEMTADIQDAATLTNLKAFFEDQMNVDIDAAQEMDGKYEINLIGYNDRLFSNNNNAQPTDTGSAAEEFDPSSFISPLQLTASFQSAARGEESDEHNMASPGTEPEPEDRIAHENTATIAGPFLA